jgi:drug/metabolite transporter (DMT)-like permease
MNADLSSRDPARDRAGRASSVLLAWYFVIVWGSGFLATKAGLQYAAPFTFLTLRFALGIAVLLPMMWWLKPRWPQSTAAWGHVVIAGLMMHAIHLSGTHYAQYTAMSAGVVAIIMAAQPLLTAAIAARWLGEKPSPLQWLGVAIGLAGVGMIVWHKLDINAVSAQSVLSVAIGLAALTAGTLYQRKFCADVDLRAGAMIQFVTCFLVLLPLSFAVEGARVQWSWTLLLSIVFLVVFASIFAVNALHTLMRRGEATRVSSMLYLPPVVAVALEWALFDVRPTLMTAVGIVITSIGVALAARK